MNYRESFKGKSKGGGKSTSDGSGGALLAGAGLGMLSGTGNNERCPLEDKSFFCQLSRFTSTLSMIIYILVVFSIIAYVIYLIYSFMSGRKTMSFF